MSLRKLLTFSKLQNCHYRDECEIILFVVRGNPKHHSRPVLLLTPKAETFFGTILGLEPKTVMTQFKAFSINGLIRSQSPDRPPSPPKILHPSPSYLATSLIPSTPLQNACTRRKLLIRSVHPRPYMPTFKQYLFLGHRPIDSDGRHQQGEGTKAWLDLMVWSSAQPHNVGNMIEKCFGVVVDNYVDVVDKEKERSGDLVAIWDVQYRKSNTGNHIFPPPLIIIFLQIKNLKQQKTSKNHG